MKPILRNPTAPADPESLRRFEAQFSITLPADYRSFLLAYNGGRLDEQNRYYYAVPSGFAEPYLVIDAIIRLEELPKRFRSKTLKYPEDLLPVALDHFGNYICLAIEGRDYGNIFFVDHEIFDEETESNLTVKIGPSFEGFVDGLSAEV